MSEPATYKTSAHRAAIQFIAACFLVVCGIVVHKYAIPHLHIRERVSSLLGKKETFATKSKPLLENYWNERTTLFASFQPDTHPDVVMAGDSLTDYAEWSELIPEVRIINRGIGGDTSEFLLKRIDDITKLKPKKVFVLIGINDIGQKIDPEVTISNSKDILQAIDASGAKPIYQSIIYPAEKLGRRAQIDRINSAMKAYCDAQDFAFLDLNASLAPSGSIKDDITSDGLHLLGPGYKIWADAIRPLVK